MTLKGWQIFYIPARTGLSVWRSGSYVTVMLWNCCVVFVVTAFLDLGRFLIVIICGLLTCWSSENLKEKFMAKLLPNHGHIRLAVLQVVTLCTILEPWLLSRLDFHHCSGCNKKHFSKQLKLRIYGQKKQTSICRFGSHWMKPINQIMKRSFSIWMSFYTPLGVWSMYVHTPPNCKYIPE